MIRRPILIVGATGTLGENILPFLLEDPSVSRVRCLSRGEHRQIELQERIKSDRLDVFIGDVRDKQRIYKASRDCQAVFHFASVKSVDKAEYDPWECVLTGIIGTQNVIDACIDNKVDQALFSSTDKAVDPHNLYGACKLVAEKLFIQGNVGNHSTKFAVCRYGNVLSSQGSVVSKWKRAKERHECLDLMSPSMTRFFILPKEAARFVYNRWKDMKGGEIFVPRMKSTTLEDLRRAFDSDHPWRELPIRPGEKKHECLISKNEWDLVSEEEEYFIRWPSHNMFPVMTRGKVHIPTDDPQEFTSYTASRYSIPELKEMIECLNQS